MRRLNVLTLSAALLLPATAFAGPSGYRCEQTLEECLNVMVTKLRSTGFIGVELDESKDSGAFVVAQVVKGSPAEKAGILVGDELSSLNGIPFDKNEKNYKKMGKVKKPGKEVHVTIKRDGAAKKIRLTLAAMPADLMAKYIGEHMMAHVKSKEIAKR